MISQTISSAAVESKTFPHFDEQGDPGATRTARAEGNNATAAMVAKEETRRSVGRVGGWEEAISRGLVGCESRARERKRFLFRQDLSFEIESLALI